MSSGKKAFYDRLNCAKTYLKNFGLIESKEKNEIFKVTQDRCMLVKNKSHYIDSKYLRKYTEFVEYIERSSKNKLSDELAIEDNKRIHKIKLVKTPFEELEE